MSAHVGGDALRLLRAINAHQAHGRVGSIVVASAVARAAGLEPGTERYEEAVWRLLVEGALEVDGSVPPGGRRGCRSGVRRTCWARLPCACWAARSPHPPERVEGRFSELHPFGVLRSRAQGMRMCLRHEKP